MINNIMHIKTPAENESFYRLDIDGHTYMIPFHCMSVIMPYLQDSISITETCIPNADSAENLKNSMFKTVKGLNLTPYDPKQHTGNLKQELRELAYKYGAKRDKDTTVSVSLIQRSDFFHPEKASGKTAIVPVYQFDTDPRYTALFVSYNRLQFSSEGIDLIQSSVVREYNESSTNRFISRFSEHMRIHGKNDFIMTENAYINTSLDEKIRK